MVDMIFLLELFEGACNDVGDYGACIVGAVINVSEFVLFRVSCFFFNLLSSPSLSLVRVGEYVSCIFSPGVVHSRSFIVDVAPATLHVAAAPGGTPSTAF